MELGTVADWVGALSGAAAVGAAITAWQVSRRQLGVEQSRDKERAARAAREQAELVFVLGAKLPDRSEAEAWAIALYNGSTKPIFDVQVESQRLDGSAANRVLSLGAVPPGRFVVPSHAKYHWGALVDLERTDERVDYLVKGRGAEMIRRVTFRDASRRFWCLENGTTLQEAKLDVKVDPEA